MPSIHTVKGLEQRADLYHQVGTSLGAGIPLAETFQFLARESHGADRAPLAASVERLRKGSSLTEALRQSGETPPAFDIALLAAAEHSGHLDAACRRLGEHYSERAKITRKVHAQLIYPAFLLHMAVLVFPVSALTALFMQGSVASFVMSKLLVLAPLYAGVYLVLRMLRGEGRFEWRLFLDRALAHVPLLGSARRNLALASLCAALEGLVRAGVSMGKAWETAAAASGSPILQDAVSTWPPVIEAGESPSNLLSKAPEFPATFTKLYRTGEMSGKLDETLERMQRLYQEEGSRQLQTVAEWTPRLIYFGIALAIAVQVISFYSGYFSSLGGL
jgi:type II secretory pathway component PulF